MSNKDSTSIYDELMKDNEVIAKSFIECLSKKDNQDEFSDLVKSIENLKDPKNCLLLMAQFIVDKTTDAVWEEAERLAELNL